MIETVAGQSFQASLEATPGLGAALGVRIVDPATELAVVPRVTAGINEFPAGYYTVDLTCPTPGDFVLVWEWTDPPTLASTAVDDLRVLAPGAVPSGIPGPITAALIRQRSPLLAARYPAAVPYDPATDALAPLVLDSMALVESLTGRDLGLHIGDTALPDAMWPLAWRAVSLKAEALAVVGGTAKERQTAIKGLALRSFTAGPYSESYFGPGEAQSAGVLDPDPQLHEVLWALATPEMRDYWLRIWGKLVEAPAAAVQQFAWGLQTRRRRY